VSLNQVVREGLDAAIRVAEEKARYDAYTLLGMDADTNTDYAAHAQAEVMLSEDPD
jgi:hypothetical protein